MIDRLTLLVALAMAGPAFAAESMPEDFVYLRDVDPSIQQDMRYAGDDNFTSKPVPGYDAAECVLVREAAEALKAAGPGAEAVLRRFLESMVNAEERPKVSTIMAATPVPLEDSGKDEGS